jgi:NDP-sugar pyrophosphorylase family protein
LRAHSEADATMTVYRNRGAFGPSNVALAGDWVEKYEKGSQSPELDCIDYGAIALRRSLLAEVADGAVWGLEALWSQLARKRKLRAFVAPERFYEVGSPEGRRDLERHLAQEVTT